MSFPLEIAIESEHYRVTPTCFPPIDFFEDLVDAEYREAAYALESRTNDRLRDEVGAIHLVAPKDRVYGPGATIVMAAFTHIGKANRFSDGSFGVYYAGNQIETAIRETVFDRERFLACSSEPPIVINMAAYRGELVKPLFDIRETHAEMHDPDIDSYPRCQPFAKKLREQGSWGLAYRSVRHPSGECFALFRPPATTLPVKSHNLNYHWNGKKIVDVAESKGIHLTLSSLAT